MIRLCVSSLAAISVVAVLIVTYCPCTKGGESTKLQSCAISNEDDDIHDESTCTTSAANNNQECKLFLAESSIPNAGLGIYTAADINRGDPICPADIALPILDYELHNDYKRTPRLIIKDYAWSTTKIGATPEAQRMSILSPGIGMIGNGHPGLHNVAISTAHKYDGAGMHRAKDPGTGSITPYHDVLHYATADIVQGSELFHSYGKRWFKSREDKIGMVPFEENYREADTILKKAHGFFVDAALAGESIERNLLANNIWSLIRKGNATEEEIDEKISTRFKSSNHTAIIKDGIALIKQCRFGDIRTRIALPTNTHDVAKAARIGSARFAVPNFIRSKKWLEDNGLCLDKLQVGPSTISQAGRGAFASRPIVSGDLVAPAPLLHIPDESLLEMYVLSGGGPYGQPKKLSTAKTARQVLLGYTYSHHNSSMLLFPYSSTVNAINHNYENPNTRLRWSASRYHKADWLSRSVEELAKETSAGLMMEFVAIRDIEPGEEITISYGQEFESAWIEHVNRWKSVAGANEYISAAEKNKASATKLFREETMQPYPANIELVCYFCMDEHDCELSGHQAGTEATSLLSTIEDYSGDEARTNALQWKEAEGSSRLLKHMHPCALISSDNEDGDMTYLALLSKRDEPKTRVFVKGIPRRAVRYVDKQYTSDIHLANAFRRKIAFPDDMWPDAWKNKS